jgi:uncharacterized protein YndB with AHSA1/START domain
MRSVCALGNLRLARIMRCHIDSGDGCGDRVSNYNLGGQFEDAHSRGIQMHFARTSSCLITFFLFAIAVFPSTIAIAGGALENDPPVSEQLMKPNSVHITWHFAAPPQKVWSAWAEPEAVRQWFGSDPKGKVLAADLAVTVGGRFEVTFADSDGTQHTASGVYQQVEPHRLLVFTWGWKSEPGVETLITVSLFPEGDGTRMEFEHGGLVHASSHDYKSGWRSTFLKFEKVLASEN